MSSMFTNRMPSTESSFDERGVRPEDIKTVEDVVKLPMTNKDILRESYPMKMACVPRDRIVEMHMSSGSTGTPVVMPYTRPIWSSGRSAWPAATACPVPGLETPPRSRLSSASSTAALACITVPGLRVSS